MHAHLVRDVIICIVAGQLLRVFWAVRVRKVHNIIVIDEPMVVVNLYKSAQHGKQHLLKHRAVAFSPPL